MKSPEMYPKNCSSAGPVQICPLLTANALIWRKKSAKGGIFHSLIIQSKKQSIYCFRCFMLFSRNFGLSVKLYYTLISETNRQGNVMQQIQIKLNSTNKCHYNLVSWIASQDCCFFVSKLLCLMCILSFQLRIIYLSLTITVTISKIY